MQKIYLSQQLNFGLLWLMFALGGCAASGTPMRQPEPDAVLIHAARLFDGQSMKTDISVLIEKGVIVRTAAREEFDSVSAKEIDLGDATLLPGFIELHAHLGYRLVPAETVLKHGITTLRDVGGPVHRPFGGQGTLRVLTSGPIITAPGGYPIPLLGTTDIAIPVETEEEAREAVRKLVAEGASLIKVALEPGGESEAPWAGGHHHTHSFHRHGHRHPSLKTPWPLLSESIASAIVDEAHRAGRRVAAHIGEAEGASIAVKSHIDEWAHVPCEPIPEALLKQAAVQKITVVTTIDTLSKCRGVVQNLRTLAALGVELLYGAEIAHPDIPWGIDAQELIYLSSMAELEPLEVLRSATSRAGRYLGIPLLGTIQAGAPADIIAVPGDPTYNLKSLEYPVLVMSGGEIVAGPE